MITALLMRYGLSANFAALLSKIIGYAAVVLAIMAYGMWRHHQGVEETTEVYEQKLTSYRVMLDKQEQEANAAISKLKTAQATELSTVTAKLEAAEARTQQVKTIIKEVKRYVTVEADSKCVVPAGAVELLDLPLSDQTTPPVPSGDGKDVDAASGIALSAIIARTAENLSECVERGEVIEAWQDWYSVNLKAWKQLESEWPKPVPVPK